MQDFLSRLLRGGIGAVIGPRLVVIILITWIVGFSIYMAIVLALMDKYR
jgi:hypothetical protein